MRTTLTLDDDVAAALERLRKRSDSSFRDVVNQVLRRGLQQALEAREPSAPYVMKTHDCGKPLIGNLDNIAEVIAAVEGDWHR